MRISKATREEAIEWALIAATDQLRCDDDYPLSSAGDDLIDRALSEVWNVTRFGLSLLDDYLEAAALLRDGWSPGDPVVLLRGCPMSDDIIPLRPSARYRAQPDPVSSVARALVTLFGEASTPYVSGDGTRVHVALTLDAAAVALLVEIAEGRRG